MQYSATLIAIMLCLVCIYDSLHYCIVKLCEFLIWWGDPLSCEWVNWASGLMCQKLVSQCLSTASVNMNECKLYYKLQTKYILNPQLSCKVTWSGLYIYVPSYPLFQHWNKDTTVWNSWYIDCTMCKASKCMYTDSLFCSTLEAAPALMWKSSHITKSMRCDTFNPSQLVSPPFPASSPHQLFAAF